MIVDLFARKLATVQPARSELQALLQPLQVGHDHAYMAAQHLCLVGWQMELLVA